MKAAIYRSNTYNHIIMTNQHPKGADFVLS